MSKQKFKRTKSFLKRMTTAVAALFVSVGAVQTFAVVGGSDFVTTVEAAGTNGFEDAFNELAGTSGPAYNRGIVDGSMPYTYTYTYPNYTLRQLADVSASELHANGADCTATTAWLLIQGLRNEGLDPWNYLDPDGYPGLDVFGNNLESWGWTKKMSYADAEPGDIIIWGQGVGHAAIVLNSDGDVITGDQGYTGLGQWEAGSSPKAVDAIYGVYHTNIPHDFDVDVYVDKASSNPSVSAGNSQYGLSGAQYSIFADSSCTSKIGTVTTDASGKGSTTVTVDNSASAIYVKETVAPSGYKPTPGVKTLGVSPSNPSVTMYDSEELVYDPIGITLEKKPKDAVTKPAPLDGAQFTVRYYDTQASSISELAGRDPARTWIIETKDIGGKYFAKLEDAYLVGGDDLYRTPNGTPILPVGSYTIEETTPPTGYVLEGATIDGKSVIVSEGTQAMFRVISQNGNAVIDGGSAYLHGENETEISDESVRGGIKFSKYDVLTHEPEGDANFANATFAIINKNDYDVEVKNADGSTAETIAPNEAYYVTTDENGAFESADNFLPYGKYTLEETTAPEGYTIYIDLYLDDTMRTVSYEDFEIAHNGEIVDMNDMLEEYPIMGGFMIQKYDFEMGTDTQGDAPNLVTEFKLYNRSAKSVRVLGEDYAPGEVIMTGYTDEDGIYESEKDILPYGTYEIIETNAPVGYKMEGKLNQTFQIREDHEYKELTTFEAENPDASNSLMNDVVTGHFELLKTRGKNNDSSTSVPEVGVEFAAIHKEFVDSFRDEAEAALEAEGKFDEKPITESQRDMLISRRAFLMAYKAIAEATGNGEQTGYNTKEDWTGDLEAVLDLEENGLTKKEWSVFRTGKDGRGISRDLAFGDYVVGQTRKSNVAATEETDEREVLEDVWVFSVTTEHVDQETKYYTVVNNPQQYFLKVVKRDANTGETVILNSADFQVSKIRDVDGNIIDLPVTQNVGFAQYDTFETNAINTAKGIFDFRTYLSATDDEATVALPDEIEAGDYEVIETLTPWGFVTIDPVPFHLNENIAETDERGEFIAVVEINDERALGQIDLQKSINEWDEADVDLVSHDFTQIGFTLKAAEDIINPDDGEVLYAEGDVISLIKDETGVYRAPIKAEEYELADVSEPTLDEEGHLYLNDLPLGTYTLKETKTLDGLVVTDTEYTITFEQDDAQKVEGNRDELVTVVDNHGNKLFEAEDSGNTVLSAKLNVENDETHWKISKTDVTGQKELPGALLTVTEKETGKVVDEWTSTEETHNISGLKIDTDYILTEIASPEDEYAIAVPIEFHVENDATVHQVHMVNKLVTLTKTDVGGEELPGAEMSVTDMKGNVIDSWTSTEEAHKIKHLHVGETYVLHENTAPLGFVKATDVEFTVLDDGADQHEILVDKILTVTKTDVTGGEELPGAALKVTDKETGAVIDEWISGDAPHQISGLEEGRTYILTEDTAPLGFVKASSVEFLVTGADEEGKKVDQQVHMIDKIVEVSKTDVAGSEELPGAQLYVTDKETGEKVDQWISGDAPHKIGGLEEGRTYILTENLAPLGYVKASSIEFFVESINEEGVKVDQHIHMVDKIVDLTKTDVAGGEELPGAHIIITDKETGETVDEWTSGNEPHRIENLEVGKTYIFHEEGAPDGHYYATDSEFFVDDDGIDTHLEVVDAPIEYEIYKINSKDGSIVEGVTLELVDLTAAEEEPAPAVEPAEPADNEEGEAPEHQVYIDDKEAEPEFIEPEEALEPEETPATDDAPETPVMGETGVMVEGFPVVTTADGPIKVGDKLIAGHTYRLTETKWVKGVHKAVSIEFTVDKYAPAPNEDGIIEPITITMVDEFNALAFQKVDDNGKPLAGAEFEIWVGEYDEDNNVVPVKDENGNPVIAAKFVSTNDEAGVSKDVNGVELAALLLGDDRDDDTAGIETDQVYILHEAKAPFGYELAEDHPFTVTGTEEAPQVIRVADKRHHFYVSAVKVDATNRKSMLKGAEITIYNAKTNEVAKTVDGKKAVGVTDGRGVIMFELAYSEDGYYAMETAAPVGYLLSKEKYPVVLSEDYNFAKDNPVVIVVADTPQSKTGVGAPITAGGIGVAAAAAAATMLATRRKKEDNESDEQ